jgi:NAD(P)-dependent dehydrogenase (short-subunit alcohol dehydrogenase family)
MKNVLITGANKGLGFEASRQFAKLGYQVIMSGRNEELLAKAAMQLRNEGYAVDLIKLDVTKEPDIEKAYAYINDKYGVLDILVNNAAVQLDKSSQGGSNTTLDIPMPVLRETFDINFFGMIALTRAMMPLIEKSTAGRIVNVTSVLGSLSLHSNPDAPIAGTKSFAYNASKTAVNQFTVHLASALKETHIKVNAAHPGWVKTGLGGPNAPLETTDGVKTIINLATLPDDGPTGTYQHMGKVIPW